jgi:hypothetical protein
LTQLVVQTRRDPLAFPLFRQRELGRQAPELLLTASRLELVPLALGDVDLDADDAERLAVRAARRDPSENETPARFPRPGQQPELVLKGLEPSLEKGLHEFSEPVHVLGMDHWDDRGCVGGAVGWTVAKRLDPAGVEDHLAGPDVPVPRCRGSGVERQPEALLAHADRFLELPDLGEVRDRPDEARHVALGVALG